jgi:hypothetical protein
MNEKRIIEKFTWFPVIIRFRRGIQINWLEKTKIEQELINNRWKNKKIL